MSPYLVSPPSSEMAPSKHSLAGTSSSLSYLDHWVFTPRRFLHPQGTANTYLKDLDIWRPNFWHNLFNVLYFPHCLSPWFNSSIQQGRHQLCPSPLSHSLPQVFYFLQLLSSYFYRASRLWLFICLSLFFNMKEKEIKMINLMLKKRNDYSNY